MDDPLIWNVPATVIWVLVAEAVVPEKTTSLLMLWVPLSLVNVPLLTERLTEDKLVPLQYIFEPVIVTLEATTVLSFSSSRDSPVITSPPRSSRLPFAAQSVERPATLVTLVTVRRQPSLTFSIPDPSEMESGLLKCTAAPDPMWKPPAICAVRATVLSASNRTVEPALAVNFPWPLRTEVCLSLVRRRRARLLLS